MATLTDDQLDAWRAKRTGRPQAAQAAEPAHPDGPRVIRAPGATQTVPDFLIGDNLPGDPPNDPPMDPPADPAPASDPAPNAELEALRSQLAAANGRLGPTQRQLEDTRAAYEATQRQMAELQAQLKDFQAAQSAAQAKSLAESFDPFEGMSREEIELLDPTAAELIKRAARNAYSKAASSIKDPEALINDALAKRDARTRDNYIRATADTLGLVKLGSDPKFTKFLEEDDAAGILLNAFVQSQDMETARSLEPKIRQMLKRYEKATATAPSRTPDPQDRLSNHLDRNNGGQSGGRRQAVSAEEAKQIRNEAARLTRARKFKEAEALLQSINY